jgi:hypothetical protein
MKRKFSVLFSGICCILLLAGTCSRCRYYKPDFKEAGGKVYPDPTRGNLGNAGSGEGNSRKG